MLKERFDYWMRDAILLNVGCLGLSGLIEGELV